MKQNGVIRTDEGVGVVYYKIEESESFVSKARSWSRSFLNRDVGVGVEVVEKIFNSAALILTHYEIPQTLIAGVLQMYDYTFASVSTSRGDTESFTISPGVLQGDTLSPCLFINLIDYITYFGKRYPMKPDW